MAGEATSGNLSLSIADDGASPMLLGMGLSRSQITRLVILALVVIAVIIVAAQFGLRPAFERAVGLLRDAGPVPFFSAMVVLPAFGAPLSLFSVPAAPAFAPDLGTPLVMASAVAALAANMALTYWLAAYAFRPLLRWLVLRFGYRIPELPAGTEWHVTLLVRLIPGPPLFVQSYLLGLARVPFGIYMIVSVAVTGSYTVATILAVTGIASGNPVTIAFAAIVIIAIAFTVHRLRGRLRQGDGASVVRSNEDRS